MLQDVRHGLRVLRKNPAFAAMAVLTLALGIGATTMVFSIVDAVLLNPFPYREAGRLVTFHIQQANYSGPPDYSVSEFLDFRNTMRGFRDLIGDANSRPAYRISTGSQQARAAWVTTNTFEVLGVEPQLGRPILPEDETPGAPPACVISDRFWREHFNGDPKALGSTLDLDGELRTLVGIMPARFQFLDASVWLPADLSSKTGIRLEPLARLKPGVSVQAATAEFDTIARRISNTYPEYDRNARFTASVRTLLDDAVGSFKRVLYTVIAAVAMLLLIACGNAGNLLLVRASAREREIAIRSAVGATRVRIIRQLLIEGWILAVVGGVSGVILAYFGLDVLVSRIPRNTLPSEALIGLNWTAIWFALVLTLVTTLLCGLAPALRATRLKPGRVRLRGGLVVVEVALSMVLLIGAGLMTRTLFAITHVDLGFNPSNLLETRLVVPRGQDTLLIEVRDRVGRMPGVIGASLTMESPPFFGGSAVDLDVPGKSHSGRWSALLQFCDDSYFKTLGRSFTNGKNFSITDTQAIVVNEAFARAFLGGEDPVGQRVRFDFSRMRDAIPDPNFQVIGVVSDAKNNGLRESIRPQAYLPRPGVRLLLKTAVPPLSMVETIRRQIWAIDPSIIMLETATVEQSIGETAVAEPRFATISVGAFAAIALVLVAVGIFGVMAYTVSLRTHEIGIRIALGATQIRILGAALGDGLKLTGAGIVIGLLVSLTLTRFMTSQLWGVSATDPLTFAGVTAVLAASGLIACYLPARRAARVDPMRCLTHE
jgi:putative ABC transport system permease protein